ncbi:hypothetical protein GCM10027396_13260 [Insolitispirillum peregrinum]
MARDVKPELFSQHKADQPPAVHAVTGAAMVGKRQSDVLSGPCGDHACQLRERISILKAYRDRGLVMSRAGVRITRAFSS